MLAVPSLNELCRCIATETGSVAGAPAGVVQPDSSGTPSPPTAAARRSARRDSTGSPIGRA
jgi:hypothetical protein